MTLPKSLALGLFMPRLWGARITRVTVNTWRYSWSPTNWPRVEVVEETLKRHEVRLLNRKTLPALDLPKVKKNKFVEILPINVGCLGACTYCKTKHARGHLGSYIVDSLLKRVKTVKADGVKEIWLSSEDTGAYGREIGVNLPILLNAIVAELPPDGSTMLRIGMTNPPFVLEHMKEVTTVLHHPCVYSFLHVPVQYGSDGVLTAMNRKYTVSEFRTVVYTLTELVPGMQIATDIICGFPVETDEDFAQTVNLIKEYKFPQVHISQFYPRRGTPAARTKKVPSTTVKNRSREITSVFEAFMPYNGIILGSSAMVNITFVGRWSVFGEVIEVLTQIDVQKALNNVPNQEKLSPCSNQYESCACSKEPEPCSCGPDIYGEKYWGAACCGLTLLEPQ
ncbi:hypothetical protein V6N11_063109 [Hibiscus sabdariffa]|uniref:Radical SAM core domain-containing protein n=1 Tax=Hibiscus sabdariffa TaxID=183260 RepID=A0ABR2NE98_9ROSI